MTDTYCMYLRKSRQDIRAEKEGEEETLARHKKILTDLAVKKGYYIGHIYQEVVSGETIKDRPEIQQMIQDCYRGLYKGILIVEVTRLSRGNQGDAQVILDCLKYSNTNNGLLVITPTKIYDVAHSSEDEEFMEFELFLSRREYKMIQKRLERGRRQAVVEGNYMGSHRPYGYNILKNKTGRTLTPHPDEAPIVKLMFSLASEGVSTYKIAQRLQGMNIPTLHGSEWSKETIRDILSNPTYTGKVRWNDRMVVKTIKDGQIVTTRPRSTHTDQYMLYEGKHEALISDEVFDAVNSRFKCDRTKSGLPLANPLAGILVCSKCGLTLRLQAYKNRPTVLPRYIHPCGRSCNCKSVIASELLEAVVDGLKAHLSDFTLKVDNLPTNNETLITDQITALQRELKRLEGRLTKLFESWEDGLISDNEFIERKTVNTEKIDSIKTQISTLNVVPEQVDYEEKITTLHKALELILDDSVNPQDKNDYLKSIIDRIEYSRSGEQFSIDIYLHH